MSAIVGYKLPAPSGDTFTLPATKKNDEISSVVTSCSYGSETSLAALPKDVILEYVVTSRPLTAAEIKKGLAQAQQLKMTFVPYKRPWRHGLLLLVHRVGDHDPRVESRLKALRTTGPSTYSKLTSKSQLASLVRLAEKL